MFAGRGRGRGRGAFQGSSNAPLKGLFNDGSWHCNCEPRLPAVHFQVNKGNKNHGRWFYTCQKPQPKRCNFFLWDDDAKVREKSAVLSNSRSEPTPAPQTPSKSPRISNGRPTPSTASHSRTASPDPPRVIYTPSKGSSKTKGMDVIRHEDEESYDWPSSNDEDLVEAAAQVAGSNGMAAPPPETPRKAAKTTAFASLGKRRFDEMESSNASSFPTASSPDDVFATPGTSQKLFPSQGLLSPAETPTPGRFKDATNGGPVEDDCNLATSVLTLLNSTQTHLDDGTRDSLLQLLNKFDLKTQGIAKGREISRLAIKAKDKKIAELQDRIAGLEAERETSRAVIAHLKRDMGTPRGRGKGR